LVFCFFVPPWSKSLWMSNDPSLLSPWELLGRLALCPRYLGLFWDLGFWDGDWGMGMHLVCLFTSGHLC
jgi:hypothetical protein